MSEPASEASSEPHIPDSQPDRATLGSLRRLAPYLRPYRWPLLGGGLAALLGTLAGLVVPLITRAIVDGPIARGDVGALPWLVLGVLAFGALEARVAGLNRGGHAPAHIFQDC